MKKILIAVIFVSFAGAAWSSDMESLKASSGIGQIEIEKAALDNAVIPVPVLGMKNPDKAGAIADASVLAKARQFLMERENAHIDYMDQVSGDPGHNAVSLLVWSTKDRYTFLQNTRSMLPANHAAAQIISNGLQRANQILQSNGTGWYDGGLDTLLYETVRAAYAALR